MKIKEESPTNQQQKNVYFQEKNTYKTVQKKIKFFFHSIGIHLHINSLNVPSFRLSE